MESCSFCLTNYFRLYFLLFIVLFYLFILFQEGQESSIAYSKCKADIDVMRLDMEALMEKVNSAPNTEGLGGIPGLFGERYCCRYCCTAVYNRTTAVFFLFLNNAPVCSMFHFV